MNDIWTIVQKKSHVQPIRARPAGSLLCTSSKSPTCFWALYFASVPKCRAMHKIHQEISFSYSVGNKQFTVPMWSSDTFLWRLSIGSCLHKKYIKKVHFSSCMNWHISVPLISYTKPYIIIAFRFHHYHVSDNGTNQPAAIDINDWCMCIVLLVLAVKTQSYSKYEKTQITDAIKMWSLRWLGDRALLMLIYF